ncbi:MAG: TetR/AcrR family transcriptional regulator [Myxococcota bacterium]
MAGLTGTEVAEGLDGSSLTVTTLRERAAELFAKKGFAGASVREIAAAAGVTKPTLYYHFGSKEGLIRDLIADALVPFVDSLRSAAADEEPLRAVLTRIASERFAYADTHPATTTLICRLAHEPPDPAFADLLVDLQQEAVQVLIERFRIAHRRGEIESGGCRLLALNFLGALLMHARARLSGARDGRSAPGIAEDVVQLFLMGAGVRPQK